MEKEKSRIVYQQEEVKNFKELLLRTTEKYPENIAYKYKRKNAKGETEYVNKTYSEFKRDIQGLATKLLNMGLKNNKIAVIGNNRYEWCTTYLAVTTGGMVIVPLDKALPQNELESLIIRSGVEGIVCEEKYLQAILELKKSQKSNLKHIICMDELKNIQSKDNKTGENTKSNLQEVLNYQSLIEQGKELIEQGNNEYEKVVINEEEMSIMLFTSGTTSISKGVMLSQKNICSNVQAIASYVKLYPTDTLLSFLPIHHTFECTITFLYGLYWGVTVAFCDGLKYIQKNMNEYKVTIFVAVPLVLENIYKKVWKGIEEQGKTKLMKTIIKISKFLLKFKIDIRKKAFKPIINQFGGVLRAVLYGAAPMNKELILGFNDFGVELIQGYGLTETSPVIACETDKEKMPGSVGLPLYNLEVKIESPNEEGIGEIAVKGPSIMLGYYKNEEATQKALKDGWLYTGDYGYIDEKGFLYVSGRKSDVIVLKNGKNVYPQEVEFVINQLPYVEESLVYARNKNSMDTMLCAKIVYSTEKFEQIHGNKTVEEIQKIIWEDVKEVNKTLPDVKHIKEIIVTDKPLSKTTTQKVKRFEEIKNL